MGVIVWRRALLDASSAWSDQADDLYGARKSLDGIDTSLLGPRVSPAADAFLDVWTAQVQDLRQDAEEHAAALSDAALTWIATDAATVEGLQRLLPWDERTLTPEGGAG